MYNIQFKKYTTIAAKAFAVITIFTVFYYMSLKNYLLFHTLGEFFSIIVATAIFILAWNLRDRISSNYILLISIAYAFVAFLDLIHTLSYSGMGVFSGMNEANTATQLWIASRYIESVTLLIAPFFIRSRNVNYIAALFIYFLITSVIVISIFWLDVFPDCYQLPHGLTVFKITSEYIISAILILSLVILAWYRSYFSPATYRYVAAAIILTVLSELAFTAYTSVYGVMNFIGHMLKLASFYLIYLTIIGMGLRNPFNVLFREIQSDSVAHRRENVFIRSVLNNIDLMVSVLDTQGRIILFNRACEDLTGYKAGEVLNKKFWDIFIREDELDDIKNIFSRLTAGQFPVRHENYWITRDGSQNLISWTNMALFNNSNMVEYIIATGIDVTNTRELEEERKNFIHMIAHDMRSPIVSIRLFVNRMLKIRDTIEREKLFYYLELIRNESARMLDLINEFLDFSLHREDRLVLDVHPISVTNLLEEVTQTYSPIAEEKGLVLKFYNSYPGSVLGDYDRLYRVFTNLLDNAIKYAAQKIDITVDIEDNSFSVSIHDDGSGITPQNMDTVFEPYSTAVQHDKRTGGYGIGLAYVKAIVEEHEGRIEVSSSPASGTNFTVYLPLLNDH